MAAAPVLVYFHLHHEQASLDPGPQDRQHNAVPLRSQELERTSDVFRRFRPALAAAWSSTAAQDPQSYASQRGQRAVAKAQGPGVEAGGPPVGRRGCVPWSGVKPEACDLIGDQ
jgi:hypothetical protein